MEIFELISPSKELVEQYNSFWNCDDGTNWYTKLFEEQDYIDIRKYIKEEEFKAYHDHDKSIVETQDIVERMKLINKYYSTRFDYKKIDVEDIRDLTLDGFVGRCKDCTGTFAYSFATKLFSFLDGDNYPIMDSYVVTLLEYYLKKNGVAVKKTDWGDYEKFKTAYGLFIKKYDLNGLSYKQIDIFLWTYGKAIQSYWQKAGVLSFASIPYKCRKKND